MILLKGSYDEVNVSEFERFGYKFILEKPFDSEKLLTMSARLMSSNNRSQKPGAVSQSPKKIKKNDSFLDQINIKKPTLQKVANKRQSTVTKPIARVRKELKGQPAFNQKNFNGNNNRKEIAHASSLTSSYGLDETKINLEDLIKKEVKRVFESEFKSIASEVIRSQLKSLSEERSRFLMEQ